MSDEIAEHYKRLFKQHGDTFAAASWPDAHVQAERFKVLVGIDPSMEKTVTSILDFGCGTAQFVTYLRRRDFSFSYVGVENVFELRDCAKKKFPYYDFYADLNFVPGMVDYAFVSGVFNNKREGERRFWRETLTALFAKVKKGLAFNMLSAYVDYQDPKLFYEWPEKVVEFVKEELSWYTVLRNEYQLYPGAVPFDFTVYVYKK